MKIDISTVNRLEGEKEFEFEGSSFEFVSNVLITTIEDADHYRVFFKKDDKYYYIPYIYLHGQIYNIDLLDYDDSQKDIYDYIDELYEKYDREYYEKNPLVEAFEVENTVMDIDKEFAEKIIEDEIYEDDMWRIGNSGEFEDEYTVFIKKMEDEYKLFGFKNEDVSSRYTLKDIYGEFKENKGSTVKCSTFPFGYEPESY